MSGSLVRGKLTIYYTPEVQRKEQRNCRMIRTLILTLKWVR